MDRRDARMDRRLGHEEQRETPKRLPSLERYVPVEVISPPLWGIKETISDSHARRPQRSPWGTNYHHTCLRRCPPSFPAITSDTGCDDVFPILSSTITHRNHVVESKSIWRKSQTAILTSVIVSSVDISAREWNKIKVKPYSDEPHKQNHRRKLHRKRNRTNIAKIDRD